MSQTALPLNIIKTIFNHKLKVLFTFLSTVITVAIGTNMATPIYETTSDLLIKFGREYLYSPSVDSSRTPYNFFNDKGVINTEIQILNTLDLAEQVVIAVGIEKIYPSPPKKQGGGIKQRLTTFIVNKLKLFGFKKDTPSLTTKEPPDKQNKAAALAARRLRQETVIRGDTAANIIHISFTHSKPHIAAEVVNTLVELYKEKHLEAFSESSAAITFFKQQVATYYKQLVTSQRKFEAFQKNNLTFLPEKQQELLLKQRDILMKELFSNELEEILNNEPLFANPEQNLVIEKGKKELLSLKLEELELSNSYKKDTIRTGIIRKQIKLIEDFLKDMPDKRVIKIRHEKIKQQLKEVNKELLNLVLNGIEYQKLKSEVALYSERYQKYKKKLDDFLLNNEMDRYKINNIKVLQKAPVPLTPILPRKEMNIATGGIVGIILGVALAFGVEFFNNWRNSSSLEHNSIDTTKINPEEV